MQSVSLQSNRETTAVNEFIYSVYNWMAVGLALTGFVAYFVANSPSMLNLIVGNKLVFYGLIFGELGLVFTLAAKIEKLQRSTAVAMYILYAVLNGATLSVIFMIYASSTITSTFFICSGTFIASSAYGMLTKKDLTSMGSFLFMGLIGIIIASVVNMFVQSSQMSMMISYIGVLVFVGLTVYDTQRLKQLAHTQGANGKGAIMGALTLYLDFINLFLMMLRIVGGGRD
ncbi:MAG: Bax inhibitor-1/YccA family protein [Deltaproteobacteria bacterium]|nr:Bax inhibitor-1/YccA family protein [Candidatus Tharpella aukensis]